MATPQTRTQFRDYCMRRLGWPVIQINVDDDQIEDRIDDALAFFNDYHWNGVEKMYMKHKITAQDISRRWIYAPDAVTSITGVLPIDGSNSSINMFDLRYQLRLHDLYDFTSVSYVSYEITMQHIQTLNLLFTGKTQFRFNRHQNKLMLDVAWGSSVKEGDYVIVECYRKLVPDTITLTGTVTGNTTSNTLIGYGTTFDQQVIENDFITIGTESKQIRNINSATQITLVDPLSSNVNNVTVTFAGVSDIWDDRWLKKYATALIKRQWGENMKKFGGIMLPGGVSLNGKEIYDEAVEEIAKIEEDMFNFNSLPSEIFTG